MFKLNSANIKKLINIAMLLAVSSWTRRFFSTIYN